MSWADFTNEVKKVYNDLTTGECFKKFDSMTDQTKAITIMKTIGIALAVGIIVGVPLGFANPIAGAVIGVGIAAVVSIAAFAYFTSSYEMLDCLKDHGQQAVDSAKQELEKAKNALIDGFNKAFS